MPEHVATPLRRLRAVPPPPATSARPGVSTVKRLIRRVIAWEVDPLREQLIDLQKASVKAAETTDARLDEVSTRTAPADLRRPGRIPRRGSAAEITMADPVMGVDPRTTPGGGPRRPSEPDRARAV